MEFTDVKDIAIYGTDCIADISRGDTEACSFVSAKEKYFDVKFDNGQLTVTQKKSNIIRRIVMRRIELKLVLPRNYDGRLRFRNKNGGLYLKCDKTGRLADLDINTKNGKVDIENVTCSDFSLKMRNGGIDIKSLDASDVFVKCSNGNIRTENIRAPHAEISCNNARVVAVDVKANKFTCSTHNGLIDVNAIDVNDLRLEASNGKITAMIVGNRNDHRLTLETGHGAITVDGVPGKNLTDTVATDKSITARTSNGDIDIRFV